MATGLRVVVADDDSSLRKLIVSWLDQLGHTVTVAEDGRGLVAACRAAAPDLAISDVRMPGLDGLAAAAVLRGELDIPVVLMSGDWTPEQAARADALGAPRLGKPFRPLTLLDAMARACPRAAPRDATTGGGRVGSADRAGTLTALAHNLRARSPRS